MGNAETGFREEGGGEDVIVIEAGAVGVLVAGALETSPGGTACERTEGGLLVGEDALPAVAAA